MPLNVLSIATLRCIIGLTQGLILYLLYTAATQTPVLWPATQPFIFVPMLVVAIFIPLLTVQCLANMRLKTMGFWLAMVTVILCGTAYYAVFRQSLPNMTLNFDVLSSPLWILCAFTGLTLFIAQTLVLSGDHDRRLMADYTTYFDMAWKLGIQFVFAAVFTLLFWGLLLLGRSLFEVIALNFFGRMIQEPWFAIPVTMLAITVALHITDVHVGIVRGVRTLTLTLLSWLLPVITLIISVFLFALFFTGLTPLWQTGHASMLLLAGAVILIILINAVYQDGQHEKSLSLFQRYTTTLAGCLLLPIIVLAVYSLSLRVYQYGWSAQRIVAAVCMLILSCYALGYAVVACVPGRWFSRIEQCNFFIAILMLVTYLALFTPVADPARLMVASQLSRLYSGQVAPEQFDFNALKLQGLHFGRQALQDLSATWHGPQTEYVRAHAKTALALKTNMHGSESHTNLLKPEEKKQLIIVHTPDGQLPASFFQNQNWKAGAMYMLPACMTNGSQACDAWIIQQDGKTPTILLLDHSGFTGFQQNAQGTWLMVGTWPISYECRGKLYESARQGAFKTILPLSPLQPDIEVKGFRIQFSPKVDFRSKCP